MKPLLFEPLEMRGMTLSNRIVVPPMTQYSANDGVAGDWHLMHLGQFAVSGAAMVFTESTYVEPHARNNPACLALYSDQQAEGLGRVIDFVHANSDAKFCVQLCHAGRKAGHKPLWEGAGPLNEEDRFQSYAPTALALREGFAVPQEMSVDRIQDTIGHFVAAARRANEAGADALELHGAHGYLIHQFLSPLSNQRGDKYGGALENRMRFGLELFEAVRAEWPDDKPMGIRISATDWVEGGWDIEGSVAFAKELDRLGCDHIHVSSGGNSPLQKIPVGPGYQTGFAAAVRQSVSARVITVGQIVNGHQAETVLRLGAADLVAVARRHLHDPRWTWRAAEELGVDLTYPKQYERAHPDVLKGPPP
ncbi:MULTISPECIES: NADH:flavin oxidoreductase/NADH oxidase [unclassified Ruegeria]|uniref:NADH:flavin oxidoreductase/NADH oxidase n=1 Tax=unclassified Ruegeria TaxID=2625375 RepID=UPI0014893B80|nr:MULTISPECIES: NADH:flavin oxidoreductase/NADH oxidase [unclassified Ruegeria]NOD85900.1 oxidoreductase [Ruegeria sp. HKCCD6119]